MVNVLRGLRRKNEFDVDHCYHQNDDNTGSEDNPGLGMVAMSEILKTLEERHAVAVSIYEVFHNHVYDVLDPKNPVVQVLEDAQGKIMLKGLSKIESELSSICDAILKVLDSKLIGSTSGCDSKAFYLKMKGDYYRYLAEFKTGDERKLVIRTNGQQRLERISQQRLKEG
ncbi:putative 14-3-3 protein [Helianthus anomalus]